MDGIEAMLDAQLDRRRQRVELLEARAARLKSRTAIARAVSARRGFEADMRRHLRLEPERRRLLERLAERERPVLRVLRSGKAPRTGSEGLPVDWAAPGEAVRFPPSDACASKTCSVAYWRAGLGIRSLLNGGASMAVVVAQQVEVAQVEVPRHQPRRARKGRRRRTRWERLPGGARQSLCIQHDCERQPFHRQPHGAEGVQIYSFSPIVTSWTLWRVHLTLVIGRPYPFPGICYQCLPDHLAFCPMGNPSVLINWTRITCICANRLTLLGLAIQKLPTKGRKAKAGYGVGPIAVEDFATVLHS